MSGTETTPASSLIMDARRLDILTLKKLMDEGSLPWDEQSPNALIFCSNGYGSPYFIGRENYTEGGEMLGTWPLSVDAILGKIDAEIERCQ